ncbi:MAG TPA: DUF5939 domain-containing protein [Pyrinomonadaceae bacterium]
MTRKKTLQQRWEFDLRSSPEALWPYVADTNRFNSDTGLPAVAVADDEAGDEATTGAPRNARRRLRVKVSVLEMLYEEEPFEWVRPHGFGVVRRYAGGPIAEMRVRVELRPREGGGTHLVYDTEFTPRASVVRLALPLQLKLMRRKFERAFRRYDRLAAERATAPQTAATPNAAAPLSERTQLTPTGRERLRQIGRALVAEGKNAELVRRLSELVERGDDLALARVRPYALADLWTADRREVLELCLAATRAGLLDFRWELLCPLCRGSADSPASLGDITAGQHCATCGIDFEVNFDRSVELTFRPNPAVRKVEGAAFCVAGPATTPHVVVQQLLRPGESRTVRPRLEEGRYRLRALGLSGAQQVRVAGAGAGGVVSLGPTEAARWPSDERLIGVEPALRIENKDAVERLFILERTSWSDQAATAAEVTALQVFRDLFAEEALRPGEQISVGSLTLLFTDLRGSTQLYRQIGDAVAFGAVMTHFDVLRESIAAEGGAIIKTLGDAVMGAFTRPAPALRAAMRAQAMLAAPPAGVRPLALKVGIHTGPCIAVTLNGRLDYFGSNVNIAARLEPLSSGSDCIISRPVRDDPKIAALLSGQASGLVAEPLRTTLKGFDAEHFDLWRVTRKEISPPETETPTKRGI